MYTIENTDIVNIRPDNSMIADKINIYVPGYSTVVKSLITCFKQKVEDGWFFTGEYHDFWELIYVTEGSIYVTTDKETKKLEKDDIIFLMPMELHKMECNDCPKANFTVISFKGDDELLAPLGRKIIKLDNEMKQDLYMIYRNIQKDFDTNLDVLPKNELIRNHINERICYNELEHFLLTVLKKNIHSGKNQRSKSSVNYDLIIDTMVAHINENLTAEKLAALCNLSVVNLKKTFKKYNDDSVMKYFNRMRINRAMQFLRMGYPISDVAYEMGYSSQNHFSVVFKRETGMLPSEFKKKN